VNSFVEGEDLDALQKYQNEVLEPEYLASLYDPEFITRQGLFFLSNHAKDDSLSGWLSNPKYLQQPHKLENTINHVHLDELVEDLEHQHEIGLILQQRWSDKLSKQFPEQEFEIKLALIEDSRWELQMWAKRDNPSEGS